MFRKLLLTLALLGAAGTAHAGDKPLYAPVPAWVVPAPAFDAAKLTDADPAIVVLDQQQRVSGNEVWTYMDQATRVISTAMLTSIGTLRLPWQPDDGDLPTDGWPLSARVLSRQ